MPNRTKKYNPLKVVNLTKKIMTKNLCLLMRLDATKGKVVVYDLVKQKQILPTIKDYKILSEQRFKWIVFIASWYVESNGKERYAVAAVTINTECKQSDISAQLNDAHQAQIADLTDRGNAVTNAGWCAFPDHPAMYQDKSLDELQDIAANLMADFRPFKEYNENE